MAGLEGQTLLQAWEAGVPLRGSERATALLAAVADVPVEEVAEFALGSRDAMLLDVYRGLCGPDLEALADCAGCGVPLEIRLTISDLIGTGPWRTGGWQEFGLGTATVRARPPTSADLSALAGSGDLAAARAGLIARCVAEVRPERPLSDGETDQLAASLERVDPLSDIRIEVGCAECGVATVVFLDIPALVWARLRVAARRLAADVGTLAARYGWAEADILAMAPARRRMYLELP